MPADPVQTSARASAPDAAVTDRPDDGRSTGRSTGRTSARVVVAAAALDAACVLGFAAGGMSSHARDGGVVGVLGIAWPFLAAAAVGWLLARAWRTPARPWPTGVAVWAVTWLGGMALRAAAGGGTAVTFVAVAGLVLGAGLVGWRLIALLVQRMLLSPGRRRRRGSPARGR